MANFFTKGGWALNPAGTAYSKWQKSRSKYARRNKRERKRIEKLNKFMMKNLKKYGDEAFVQHDALSPEQKDIMSALTQGILGQGGQDQSPMNRFMQGGQGQNLGLNQGLGQGLSEMLRGGNEAYERFAAPHMQAYERNVNELANRFAGAGLGDSSGFAQALGGAAGDLNAQLGATRAGLQQSALDRQLQGARLALGTPTQHTIYRPPTMGTGINVTPGMSGVDKFLQALAPAAGEAAGKAALSFMV